MLYIYIHKPTKSAKKKEVRSLLWYVQALVLFTISKESWEAGVGLGIKRPSCSHRGPRLFPAPTGSSQRSATLVSRDLETSSGEHLARKQNSHTQKNIKLFVLFLRQGFSLYNPGFPGACFVDQVALNSHRSICLCQHRG